MKSCLIAVISGAPLPAHDDSISEDLLPLNERAEQVFLPERQTTSPQNTVVRELSFAYSLRKTTQYAALNAGADLLLIGTSFGCAVILSYVDKETLAASSLIELLNSIIVDLSAAGLTAVSLHTIQKRAQHEYVAAGEFLLAGWGINVLLSAFAIPFFVFGLQPILLAAKQDPAIVEVVQDYFVGFAYAVLPLLGLLTNRQFLIGREQSLQAFVLVLAYSALTLCSGYGLTLGAFDNKIEAKGAYGMGLANALAAGVCFLASTCWIVLPYNRPFINPLNLNTVFTTHYWKKLGALIKTGIPLTMTALSDFALTLTVNFTVGSLGQDYLIPQGIINEYLVIILAKLFSAGESLATLLHETLADIRLPQSLQAVQIKHYFWAIMLFAQVVAVLWFTLFATIPQHLWKLFCAEGECEPDQFALFRSLALLSGAGIFVDACRIVANGALIGVGDEVFSSVVNLFLLMLLGIPPIVLARIYSQQAGHEMVLTLNAIKLLVIFVSAWVTTLRWYNQYCNIAASSANNSSNPPSKSVGGYIAFLHKCCRQPEKLRSNLQQSDISLASIPINQGGLADYGTTASTRPTAERDRPPVIFSSVAYKLT